MERAIPIVQFRVKSTLEADTAKPVLAAVSDPNALAQEKIPSPRR